MTLNPSRKAFISLRARNCLGGQTCGHYEEMIVTCTKRYVFFVKRGADVVRISSRRSA